MQYIEANVTSVLAHWTEPNPSEIRALRTHLTVLSEPLIYPYFLNPTLINMPPRTRAVVRAQNSQLTPTVLQRRAHGASSTLPICFGHSSSSRSPHSLSSPSTSAQIEEVLDNEIEYEHQDNN